MGALAAFLKLLFGGSTLSRVIQITLVAVTVYGGWKVVKHNIFEAGRAYERNLIAKRDAKSLALGDDAVRGVELCEARGLGWDALNSRPGRPVCLPTGTD